MSPANQVASRKRQFESCKGQVANQSTVGSQQSTGFSNEKNKQPDQVRHDTGKARNPKSSNSCWLLLAIFALTILPGNLLPFFQNQNVALAADQQDQHIKDFKDAQLTEECAALSLRECELNGLCRLSGGACKPRPEALNTSKPTSTQTKFTEIIAMIVGTFTPFVAMMAELSGQFLGNDWIFGKGGLVEDGKEIVKMQVLLHTMWVVIRDLVNIAFILILLVVAFASVLGAGGQSWAEKFQPKSVLPQIAIALVAVNFTWFGAKLVLDVANVTTHIVFGIWENASSQLGLAEKLNGKICIPTSVEVRSKKEELLFDEDLQLAAGEDKQMAQDRVNRAAMHEMLKDANEGKDLDCKNFPRNYGNIAFGPWEHFSSFKKINGEGLMKLFAFGILHVEMLPLSLDSDQKISDIAMSTLVSLILMIVLGVVLFGLMVALLVRVVMIWLNIVLSPIFIILPLFKEVGGGLGDLESHIGFNAFFKFAFLPAMIALPLVVGLLMVMVGRTNVLVAEQTTVKTVMVVSDLIRSVNTIQGLLWYALTIVVLWISVETANKQGGPITEAIVGKVSGFVKDQAKFLGKSAGYANIFPVYSGKSSSGKEQNVSLIGAISAIRSMESQMGTNAMQHALKTFGGKSDVGNMSPETVRELNHVLGKESQDSLGKFLKLVPQHNGDFAAAAKSAGFTENDTIQFLSNMKSGDKAGAIRMIGDKVPDSDADVTTALAHVSGSGNKPSGDGNAPGGGGGKKLATIVKNPNGNGMLINEVKGNGGWSVVLDTDKGGIMNENVGKFSQALENLDNDEDRLGLISQVISSTDSSAKDAMKQCISNDPGGAYSGAFQDSSKFLSVYPKSNP